ncbi:hypothetical protein V6N13_065002 [Hibiscus sabdariffa]
MGDAIISGRKMSLMPPCNDLQGWILKKSMKVVKSDDEKLITSCQVVEEVRFKLGLQVITNCDEQYIVARRRYTFDNDTGELAATRSATNFTILTHMVDLRNNLQPMVTSHEWIDCPYLQKPRGRKFFFSSSVEKLVFWTGHKRNFSFFITDNALPGIEERKYVIEFVLHCIACHANKVLRTSKGLFYKAGMLTIEVKYSIFSKLNQNEACIRGRRPRFRQSKGRTKADEPVPSEKRITYFWLSLWTTTGNEIVGVYKVVILNRNTPFLLVLFWKKLPQLARTSVKRVAKNSYILSNSSYRNNLDEILLETGIELEIANVYLKLQPWVPLHCLSHTTLPRISQVRGKLLLLGDNANQTVDAANKGTVPKGESEDKVLDSLSEINELNGHLGLMQHLLD